MVPALEKISATLLPVDDGLSPQEKWQECTEKFPWYPLPWLMLANPADTASVEKASLWFYDEQRFFYVLNHQPHASDKWLEEQLALLQKNDTAETATERLPDDISIRETASEVHHIEEPAPVEPPVVEAVSREDAETKTAETTPLVEAQTEKQAEQPVIPGLRINYNPQVGVKEAPLFEPYYAVDYFASQGIKLKAGTLSQDKFDKQLKSFTQWLKTMKKVSETAPAYADPMVEAQAVASNAGKEVVTEAMALVLEKQGSFDKAAAIYEKLLLLHPEKGALFAARIEDLKTKQ